MVARGWVVARSPLFACSWPIESTAPTGDHKGPLLPSQPLSPLWTFGAILITGLSFVSDRLYVYINCL